MMEGERRFERAGLVTAYAIEGAGPPVLLIHGVGARLDTWDGVVATLGGRFRTIRFDLRGHGDSSKPPGPYSATLFAEDARALLDHLGIGQCHVAGHSMGATVALRPALHAPDRVQRPPPPTPPRRGRPPRGRAAGGAGAPRARRARYPGRALPPLPPPVVLR